MAETINADGPMRQRSDDKYGQLLVLPEIRFAHVAITRLRESGAPLVTICGRAGTGKSHLARHLIQEMCRREPKLAAAHITAGEFFAEFTRASKASTIPDFQEHYRSRDLFVCEDLQELEGRSLSQQQLLAIIDGIMAHSGRVLLTSTKSPGNLSGFSAKLRSRCQGGICAAIEPLSPSSRERLILHFAEERGLAVPAEMATLLAGSLALSPRELRGMVIRLEHRGRQLRRPIDRSIVDAVIQETIVPEKPTLGQITKVVAKAFSVTASDLRSPGRLQALVLPRQLAMFAARVWAQRAYSEIGRHFQRRSHSTIVHACERVRELQQTDADFFRIVEEIREQLNLPTSTGVPPSTTS